MVYDTEEIIERAHRGILDYIKHALTLFANFVAVLIRVLVIMGFLTALFCGSPTRPDPRPLISNHHDVPQIRSLRPPPPPPAACPDRRPTSHAPPLATECHHCPSFTLALASVRLHLRRPHLPCPPSCQDPLQVQIPSVHFDLSLVSSVCVNGIVFTQNVAVISVFCEQPLLWHRCCLCSVQN